VTRGRGVSAPEWTRLLLVGCGGFLGAAARFAASGAVHRRLPDATFPWGTLLVNLVGCLAIGFLGGLLELRQLFGPSARLFLFIGVLGGFTTYSSFAFETLGLAHAADFSRAALNVVVHVVLGLSLAWLGYVLAQQL